MPKEDISKQFITCPTCEGTGRGKAGMACRNCGGLGLGVFNGHYFYYFGLRIGAATIELDRLRKKADFLVNLAAYLFGLAGLVSFGFWYFLESQAVFGANGFQFWNTRHYLLAIFWLSIFADMYVAYVFALDEGRAVRIKEFKKDLKRTLSVPNSWADLKKYSQKYKIETSSGLSDKAMDVFEQGFILADKFNSKEYLPVHLFFAALSDPAVAAIFSRLNINPGDLADSTARHIVDSSGDAPVTTEISNELKEVMAEGYIQAQMLGQRKVEAKNFIMAILKRNKMLEELLVDLNVDLKKVENVIAWFDIDRKMIESYKAYRAKARFKPHGNMDRAYTAIATPIVNSFGYDLTAAAKFGQLEYCVAREGLLEKIFETFEGGSNAIVLVGEEGVGKGSIISGIAQAMVKEEVPSFFQDKRLIEIDAARLVGGASPSEAEERMIALMDESSRSGNIILFIRDVDNIGGIASGGEGSLDLAEVLAGAIDRKQVVFLGTSTVKNYNKHIHGKSLDSSLTRIDVDEPDDDMAIRIVESKIAGIEHKHKVFFSYHAIDQAINFSKKYIHSKHLPHKAIEIIELVAAKTAKKKGEGAVVTSDDISEVISEVTKIPVAKISENEGQKLLHLEDLMHERMIGQHEAVKMVASSLRRARTQLREGKRPIASFLFLGPTGVGKTELAKTVADIYFGKEDYMIRVDMSEYQYADSVRKMIGDETGAHGHLTEAVREMPFSLVLLDEFEKAHPDILNLFLQVMDDGRLTDGQGETIDFTNSIVIATSNAGAPFIQEQIRAGATVNDFKEALINEQLSKVMRPELLNRFDGLIVFEPLTLENVTRIAELLLRKSAKILEERGIGFRADENGVRILAKQGYDPKFGARPLRRLLQDKVEDKIANFILSGDLKRRDTVAIDEHGEVSVEKAKAL